MYNMRLRYIKISTVQVENMHKKWILKAVTFQIFLEGMPLNHLESHALHATNSVEH